MINEGSVRIDLLGGTLDLAPINLIIPNVVTINAALGLKATVEVKDCQFDGVELVSRDYQLNHTIALTDLAKKRIDAKKLGGLYFLALLIAELKIESGLTITMSSGAPAGSGLGGSSAMGVTLIKALLDHQGRSMAKEQIVALVHGVEGKILDSGPAGYQDYYPALYGGVLALNPRPGKVEVEQLFSPPLQEVLQNSLTLVFSGQSRLSGINNWEVYKAFFDQDKTVRQGLPQIAQLADQALSAIHDGNHENLPALIAKEGEIRNTLFPNIMTEEIKSLHQQIKECHPQVGIKMCGAGGGGCFLLTHPASQATEIRAIVQSSSMELLNLVIEPPLP
jgi:D-glycero-alpha-D-manno-heptose-7-phosphate kinase